MTTRASARDRSTGMDTLATGSAHNRIRMPDTSIERAAIGDMCDSIRAIAIGAARKTRPGSLLIGASR
jgi:hypothetical protein